MKHETIAVGASLEDALDAALTDLGVQQDAVRFELVDEGDRATRGSSSASEVAVRVWLTEEFLAAQKAELEEELEEHTETSGSGTPDPDERRGVPHPAPALSDEELDRVADEAVAVINALLEHLGVEAEIEEYEGDEGEIILDIVGSDLGMLIGRHGRTLDALQVIASAVATRRVGFRYPVVIDVEGYRARRRERLEEIGRRSADRAVRQKFAVKLRPMSAQERRVVHMSLRDDRRVSTASEGEEPFRSVVISPNSR